MQEKSNFGYKDQEILIGAIAKHTASVLKTSEGIIRGKIRITIDELFKKSGQSLHDLKALKEKDRDDKALDFLNHFFAKLNLDIKRRRTLKYDCIQIYERWKEYKRQEVGEAEEYIPENLKALSSKSVAQAPSGISEDADSLIHDFKKLDLEGLI